LGTIAGTCWGCAPITDLRHGADWHDFVHPSRRRNSRLCG
jgi:hypothetical protein